MKRDREVNFASRTPIKFVLTHVRAPILKGHHLIPRSKENQIHLARMGKKKPRTRQNRGVVLKVDWGCESYLDRKKVPDSNLGGYKTMRQQLASMGLAIRQIPGDG